LREEALRIELGNCVPDFPVGHRIQNVQINSVHDVALMQSASRAGISWRADEVLRDELCSLLTQRNRGIQSRRALRGQVRRAQGYEQQQRGRQHQCERVLRSDAIEPAVDQA